MTTLASSCLSVSRSVSANYFPKTTARRAMSFQVKPIKTTPIDISRNENPYGASVDAKLAGAKAMMDAHTYPDGLATSLRRKLADVHNVSPKQVIVGPGSETLLDTLPSIQGNRKGKNIITFPELSFYRYKQIARNHGFTISTSHESPRWGVDMESLRTTVDKKNVRIVQLTNPSNPTGLIVKKEEIKELLDTLPSSTLFVHDAAYAEYCDDPEYSDGVEFVKDYPNLLVLKTMSKAYGLAGLRVGYGIGQQEILERIDAVRPKFWMPTASQAAAIAALEDQEHMHSSVAETLYVKSRFEATLDHLSLPYTPSKANFVLIEFDRNGWPPACVANEMLLKSDIIVRPMAQEYGLDNHLRFSIGTDTEMKAVSDALYRIKYIH